LVKAIVCTRRTASQRRTMGAAHQLHNLGISGSRLVLGSGTTLPSLSSRMDRPRASRIPSTATMTAPQSRPVVFRRDSSGTKRAPATGRFGGSARRLRSLHKSQTRNRVAGDGSPTPCPQLPGPGNRPWLRRPQPAIWLCCGSWVFGWGSSTSIPSNGGDTIPGCFGYPGLTPKSLSRGP
jgi:hypothetical protein